MLFSLRTFTDTFRPQTGKRIRRRHQRSLLVETLEHRRVLACPTATTPTIAGIAFEDFDGSSTPSPGEELAGVEIELYLQAGSQFVESKTTAGDGSYCFEGLEFEATYFVRQPQQTVNGSNLSLQQSPSIQPGQFGVMIDTFESVQKVDASPNAPKEDASGIIALPSGSAIGDHRKIIANLNNGAGAVTLSINEFGSETMQYNSTVGVTGRGAVVWDGTETPDLSGPSNDGIVMGLNGLDLTQDGKNTGVAFAIGALVAGSQATVSLYEGSVNNVSSATFEIPEIEGGTASKYQFVPFNTFSDGQVSPSDVDAIRFVIDSSDSLSNQIEVDRMGANGPKIYDFANMPEADLSVTKQNQGSSVPGETVEYVITVANAGPSAVTGAQVTDDLPAKLTAISYTSEVVGTASGNTPTGNSNINDAVNMNSGSSIIYTVEATINPDASGDLSNTVTVEAPAGVVDPDPSNNTATVQNQLNPEVDLQITKANGVDSLVPGSPVNYSIVVTNAGPSHVSNATVTDTFSNQLTGVTYTSNTTGTVSGNTDDSGNIQDTVTMSPGATITYLVNATVESTATGSLSNTATVTVPPGYVDLNPSDNTATDTDSLDPQVNLIVTKVSSDTVVVPNQELTYTITVRNEGPSTATGARLTDLFPASELTSLTYTSEAFSGASGNTLTGNGNIDDSLILPPLSRVTYSVGATVLSSASGQIENTATVDPPSGTTEINPDDNTTTNTITVTPVYDLSISKLSSEATAVAGEEVVYTIEVQNSGPSEAMGVEVTDLFPSTLSDVTYTSQALGGATGNRSNGQGNINDTINLPANASVTYTARGMLASSATGNLINTASVTAADNGPDGDPNNDSATRELPIRLEADLTMSKTVSQDVFEPGDDVVYTLVVTNEGPSDVMGATVEDIFPDARVDEPASLLKGLVGVTYSSQAEGGATGDTHGSGDINQVVNMPAGSSITYTVDATVSPFAMVSVTNTATVEVPEGVMELNPGNNSSTVTNRVEVTLRSIEGFVFVDLNNNGQRDSGDPGIPGVEIALDGADVFQRPVEEKTTSKDDGSYAFNDLMAGVYTITETPPEGFPDGFPVMGSGAVVDPAITDHVFSDLVLGEAKSATDYDFRQLRPNFSKRNYLAST
ncbi:MAG: DUF11 domain-containing protein [Planctomycetaceae bacterium]|nr:DUF11 domain-containing protein [Planctomycetaceae bacterium]